MKHTWVKTTKRSKRTGSKFEKIKKMVVATRRIFFGFQWRFLEIFLALATPHGFRSNSKENKKPSFYHILWFKRLVVLKTDERCHDIRWYCSRFWQTLVVIFPRKSTEVKIFGWFLAQKKPVKSDKLALIEGKILNLMFFDINIPVVAIEICLPVTHNQRQKTLKVASVLLFRHILKTKLWLEWRFSLLNSFLKNCSFTWNIRFQTCPDRVYRKLNIKEKPRKCLVDFRNNESVFVVSDRNIFNKKQLLC